MSPHDAIVIACLAWYPVTFLIGIIYRKNLVWPGILAMGLSGMAGAPIGSWILARASMRLLLFASAFTICLFLVWQVFVSRYKKGLKLIPAWAAWICGFISGIMTTTVGMGGPPLVFFAYLRKWNKEETIGGISMTCIVQMFAVVPSQWAMGLYNFELATLAGWAGAASCFGLVVTLPLVKHINVILFRKLVIGMLILSAANLLVKAFFVE